MGEQARGEKKMKIKGRSEGSTGEVTPKELEPLLWQAHVDEEMERIAREHQPAPALSHFAEEYAERAIRAVEASANEYQEALERGEPRAEAGRAADVADAGDIAGG